MTTDGPAPTPTAAPKHRLRKLVFIALGFLVVLGVVAGGTVYFVYDKTTEIDRSTPQVVTDQFLDAALKLKDAGQVSLFVCDNWTGEQALRSARDEAERAVDLDDPRVSVRWEDLSASVTGSSATVSVKIVLVVAINGDIERDFLPWSLRLKNVNGWRVCELTPAPSLQP